MENKQTNNKSKTKAKIKIKKKIVKKKHQDINPGAKRKRWVLRFTAQLKEGSERNRVLREEQGVYKGLVVVHAFVKKKKKDGI